MAVRYVCTTPCWHGGKKYRKGDYAVFKNASDGPRNKKGQLVHFEVTDDGREARPVETVKVNGK